MIEPTPPKLRSDATQLAVVGVTMKDSALLVDASFLISAIRSCDANHLSSYEYISEHSHSMWLIPAIAYFEYQATQSRLEHDGKGAYRSIYIPNSKILPIGHAIIRESAKRDLANVFTGLRGADLIYACIAIIKNIPLVTLDSDFAQYRDKITVINPSKNCGKVRITSNGMIHQGVWRFDEAKGILTVTIGRGKKATQLGGMTKQALARLLLRELVEGGPT